MVEREAAWPAGHDTVTRLSGRAVGPCQYHADGERWHVTAVDQAPRGRLAKRGGPFVICRPAFFLGLGCVPFAVGCLLGVGVGALSRGDRAEARDGVLWAIWDVFRYWS